MAENKTPSTLAEPLPIRRLHESLINRIAAGEIIHRPASALKELVENSLDAGTTSVRVTVKDGGMKLLQIQDNGCGIRKSDLPLLAERFTTSKISTFSDLSRIRTYGFRGEALASISHVAHLSVVTKTKTDTCAWKASYSDGSLVAPKSGQSADPKPCAGNDGTIITIEDLFYNTPTRLSALRSSSEEYSRILDVLTKYAIHNPKVAFVCKKANSPSSDLSSPSGSETLNTIRLLYGHSVAKELISVCVSSRGNEDGQMDTDEDENEVAGGWKADAYISNANYQAKKTTFLLFINHRLVDSSRMKRVFETVYNGILPKGAYPFIYLSLEIDPQNVDVNVHPTKREVHFLNEDMITEKVSSSFQKTLAAQNHSRVFQYQTLLTDGIANIDPEPSKKHKEKEQGAINAGKDQATSAILQSDSRKKTLSQHRVRTNLVDRTLDSMFPVSNPAQLVQSFTEGRNSSGLSRPRDVNESKCFLTSVLNLRQEIIQRKHSHLTEILEKHTFVGIVDLSKALSLIQHSTNLYLVNHVSLAEELFYQLGARQFGDFARLKLEPPPLLRMLVEIAVKAETTIEKSTVNKSQIVERITDILMERREMLAEYFSLSISDKGVVDNIPMLLKDYTPNLNNLPSFLMRLGPQVDWASEKECFDNFLRELAYFYAPSPFATLVSSSEQRVAEEKAERWQIQHVLFPAMRRYLVAPKSLLDNDVVQVASLPDLYKVFERC